jgi:hypothetical protein
LSAVCSASFTAAAANGSDDVGRMYSAVLNFSFSPRRSSIATAACCGVGLRDSANATAPATVSASPDQKNAIGLGG